MQGEDLRHLIPPDRRRRNAALLAFGCVVFGALLMRGGESLVELQASGWGALGPNASHARAIDVQEAQLAPSVRYIDDDATGVLTVICFPACTHVFIDDRDVGGSPLWQKQVPAGAHQLRLVADGGRAHQLSVRVMPDELKTIKTSMVD